MDRALPSSCCTAGRSSRSESTRLNSSHLVISYAVFCLKKKKKPNRPEYDPHHYRQYPPPHHTRYTYTATNLPPTTSHAKSSHSRRDTFGATHRLILDHSRLSLYMTEKALDVCVRQSLSRDYIYLWLPVRALFCFFF